MMMAMMINDGNDDMDNKIMQITPAKIYHYNCHHLQHQDRFYQGCVDLGSVYVLSAISRGTNHR